jgi:transposase
MLTPEVQVQILTLHFTDRRTVRSIAREVGLDRKTVSRVIARRQIALVPKTPERKSKLDPYSEALQEILRKDPKVTATALLNHLRSLGYTGGKTIVSDFVQKERGRFMRPREGFLRLEFGAGDVAQVDWGEFGDVFGDGIKIHCFAMVMAYSRMIYVEFTRSEKFEEFIRCHENAFRFFGGTPKECWYDNLTSAVSDRMGSLVRFNTRFMAYLGHHCVRPHACNVARGNEKGRVEDLIKYIRMNFWPGRKFTDFDDLTKQFIIWRNQIANQREHRSHRRVVRLLFETEEKPKLTPLNPVPYDTDEVFSRHVPPEFHLQYESNRYSVPWTLVGLTVTVRVNNLEIKIYYNEKFICSHPRSYLKNKVFTTEGHRAGLIARKPGSTRESWQLGYVKGLGPKMAEYVELVRQGPRSLKNELTKLIALTTVYGEEMVLTACAECLGAGLVGVDNVELYLKRRHHPSSTVMQLAPIHFESEKLNRVHPAVDLRKYDALLFEVENQARGSLGDEDGNARATGERVYRTEAEIVGGGFEGRSAENERSGAGNNLEVPESLDREGEGGSQNADDPKQDPNGEVPQTTNGGEF